MSGNMQSGNKALETLFPMLSTFSKLVKRYREIAGREWFNISTSTQIAAGRKKSVTSFRVHVQRLSGSTSP